MPFQAVAFISSEENLSEREKSIADRLISSDVLFLVMGSGAKARLLTEYIDGKEWNKVKVIRLHDPESRYLLPYLAKTTDRKGLSVDVTFASPYYASAVTVLCRRPQVRITSTQWDGETQTIFCSNPLPRLNDEGMGAILECLSKGPRSLNDLERDTGLNYKTLARRASFLLKDGHISRTDDYPIRYYMTPEQAMSFNLSPGPYEGSAEGMLFDNAAEAIMEFDEVVLDSTDI